MPRQNGRRRTIIHLCHDPIAARMEIVERRTGIAVRITRNAAMILTVAAGAVYAVLLSLHKVVELFR